MSNTYYPIEKEIEILGIHAFYYKENERDFYYKGNLTDSWCLIYVDKGEISATADNIGCSLCQGDAIFYEPHKMHEFASNGKEPNRILVINFKATGSGMEKLCNKVFTLNLYHRDLIKSISSEAENTFFTGEKQLILKSKPDSFGAFQLMAVLLECLFVEIVRHGKLRNVTSRSRGAKRNIEIVFSQSVKDYMKEHLLDNLTLEKICQHFHVGKSYLSQVFKHHTGSSVMNYYVQLKIQTAKEFLSEGELSITQIAQAVGFSGIHHFTRSFKKHTGSSPREYSKREKSE